MTNYEELFELYTRMRKGTADVDDILKLGVYLTMEDVDEKTTLARLYEDFAKQN